MSSFTVGTVNYPLLSRIFPPTEMICHYYFVLSLGFHVGESLQHLHTWWRSATWLWSRPANALSPTPQQNESSKAVFFQATHLPVLRGRSDRTTQTLSDPSLRGVRGLECHFIRL